jgi:hypothetical protein
MIKILLYVVRAFYYFFLGFALAPWVLTYLVLGGTWGELWE